LSSKSGKLLKEIANIIIIIIIAYAITEGIQLIARQALKVETPFVVVASSSMEPTLNIGDMLVVQGANPRELKVGDIVVFKPPSPYWKGIPWVHRIVEIRVINNDIKFKTKGDANAFPDPFWISEEEIIGKVVFRIPYIGLVSLTLKGWTIPAILAIILLSIAITLYSKE